ncbi:alpha-ketoacid dehydrogenase kinase [Clavulina sp. PMI_390]|nr:alpha-ketoacid dehydrogenase kinase [Clavulina sp. PMI_390]
MWSAVRAQRAPRQPFSSINSCRQRLFSASSPACAKSELSNLLESYAHLEPRPIALSSLFPPDSTSPTDALESFYIPNVQSEIPRRLARMIQRFDKLPYICGTNPFIARVHSLYKSSFYELSSIPKITNQSENEAYATRLEAHIHAHSNDIPTLSKGFSECARYMKEPQIAAFLDDTIASRIGIRLMAEQYVAISQGAQTESREPAHRSGIMDPDCDVASMVRMCAKFVGGMCEATFGAAPAVQIDGVPDARFGYVPAHIEYILTEILKNSYRATAERARSGSAPLPPVQVTIAPSSDYLSIRIRDEGGGITPTHLPKVFSYAFTTARSSSITAAGVQSGMGTIAGFGYGLPLARLYATYFGGSLELMSLHGHGTDTFIRLRRLDQDTPIEI